MLLLLIFLVVINATSAGGLLLITLGKPKDDTRPGNLLLSSILMIDLIASLTIYALRTT